MKKFNICLLFFKKLFVLLRNLKTKIVQIDNLINICYQLRFHQVLTTKQAELNKKHEDQEKLATRVAALESKLLTGSATRMAAVSPNTSFEDVTEQQKLTLEKRRQEIIEREVIVFETLYCFYDLLATFPFVFQPFFCHFNFEMFN